MCILARTQTREAALAIRAAQHRHQWGRYAARRFCETRGVPLGLYRLACQLEATKHLHSETLKTLGD